MPLTICDNMVPFMFPYLKRSGRRQRTPRQADKLTRSHTLTQIVVRYIFGKQPHLNFWNPPEHSVYYQYYYPRDYGNKWVQKCRLFPAFASYCFRSWRLIVPTCSSSVCSALTKNTATFPLRQKTTSITFILVFCSLDNIWPDKNSSEIPKQAFVCIIQLY